MPRRSISRKMLAARRFPHQVDVPVPPFGLGVALDRMVAWCNGEFGRGRWELHHWSEPRGRGVVPRDFARFYFLEAADAEAFAEAWRDYAAEAP